MSGEAAINPDSTMGAETVAEASSASVLASSKSDATVDASSSTGVIAMTTESTTASDTKITVTEKEYLSASECSYHTTEIVTGESWTSDYGSGDNAMQKETIPAVFLDKGITVRVAPMERKCGGWDEEHFHSDLALPEGCPPAWGVVVTMEAMARECLAVALSPLPSFELGKTYVVHFGANGNLSTVFRRRLPSGDGAIDASFPSLRLCKSQSWENYWVIFQKGKLSAGIGPCPGKFCIGTLDDSLYDQLRPGQDAVRYIGLGNSALGGRRRGRFGGGQRNPTDLKIRNVVVAPVPPGMLERGGIPLEEMDAYSLIRLRTYRAGGLLSRPESMRSDPGSKADEASETVDTESDQIADLYAEYELECAKNRARAKKYGIQYVEPAPDAFLKWSELRRLRTNPDRGFVTGLDVTSTEEEAKREARKNRFAKELNVRQEEESCNADGGEGIDDDEVSDDDNMESPRSASVGSSRDDGVPLPVTEAWDNEELVRKFRTDPCGAPSKEGHDGASKEVKMEGEGNDNAVQVDEENGASKDNTEPVRENEGEHGKTSQHEGEAQHMEGKEEEDAKAVKCEDQMDEDGEGGASDDIEGKRSGGDQAEIDSKPEAVLEKVHVFAIDWAAFKQIRSDDIMEYFASYGPFYVEWLGDLSCNVLFEDRFSAERALAALSQDIPSPPPDSVCVMRTGADGDGKVRGRRKVSATKSETVAPDLGSMGWRFCKYPIIKIANDRYGRKGTKARLLLRTATAIDILEMKPEPATEVPPGFTTTRILGPGSDFDTRDRNRGGKAKRARSTRRRSSTRRSSDNSDMDQLTQAQKSRKQRRRSSSSLPPQQKKRRRGRSVANRRGSDGKVNRESVRGEGARVRTRSQTRKTNRANDEKMEIEDKRGQGGRGKGKGRGERRQRGRSRRGRRRSRTEQKGESDMEACGDEDPSTSMSRGLKSSRPGFTLEQIEAERATKKKEA